VSRSRLLHGVATSRAEMTMPVRCEFTHRRRRRQEPRAQSVSDGSITTRRRVIVGCVQQVASSRCVTYAVGVMR